MILQLSTEGLKIFDSLTEEQVDRMVLSDITFSAPVNDKQHAAMFGIIAKDASLGLTACHIFELDGKGVQVGAHVWLMEGGMFVDMQWHLRRSWKTG